MERLAASWDDWITHDDTDGDQPGNAEDQIPGPSFLDFLAVDREPEFEVDGIAELLRVTSQGPCGENPLYDLPRPNCGARPRICVTARKGPGRRSARRRTW
jgi:hypothetical protein